MVTLRDHHRSHADIIGFSNHAFYEGQLRVATRYERLVRPSLDEPAVRWIHVAGDVSRPSQGGALNEREAHAVVAELERLVTQGYPGNIGVVSPFRAQANRIRDLASASDVLQSAFARAELLIDTVHKFQGDERDVMIFSPVVAAGASEGALGFVRNTPNLFNVAISRARAALIVVGDRNAAASCGVDYLGRFAEYCGSLRGAPHRPTPSTGDLGAQYPSVAKPELVSPWEHVLYEALYRTGLRPIPQYAVEKYLLDFALIAGEHRLNIEVDGELYHREWNGDLCRKDQIRNYRLMELGWDVKRFWVYQVRDDLDWCVGRIKMWHMARTATAAAPEHSPTRTG